MLFDNCYPVNKIILNCNGKYWYCSFLFIVPKACHISDKALPLTQTPPPRLRLSEECLLLLICFSYRPSRNQIRDKLEVEFDKSRVKLIFFDDKDYKPLAKRSSSATLQLIVYNTVANTTRKAIFDLIN